MREKSSRVLVTGGTKEDVAAIAVLAINIRNTNAHLFSKIIIFHDGIKDKDQKLINRIFCAEFILYKLPFLTQNDVVVNYFSPLVFCKYECLGLLAHYDEVVWSDYDVVILEKLDDICNFDECAFNIVVKESRTIQSMFYKKIESLNLNYVLDKEALTTPLFSISKDIGDYSNMMEWCYWYTNKLDRYLLEPEQCIISLMVQEFDIKYKSIDASIYACHPNDALGKEIILHAYGQPKFWNGLNNEMWNEMYKEWKGMKGTPIQNGRKRMKNLYALLTSRLKGIRADGEIAEWKEV